MADPKDKKLNLNLDPKCAYYVHKGDIMGYMNCISGKAPKVADQQLVFQLGTTTQDGKTIFAPTEPIWADTEQDLYNQLSEKNYVKQRGGVENYLKYYQNRGYKFMPLQEGEGGLKVFDDFYRDPSKGIVPVKEWDYLEIKNAPLVAGDPQRLKGVVQADHDYYANVLGESVWKTDLGPWGPKEVFEKLQVNAEFLRDEAIQDEDQESVDYWNQVINDEKFTYYPEFKLWGGRTFGGREDFKNITPAGEKILNRMLFNDDDVIISEEFQKQLDLKADEDVRNAVLRNKTNQVIEEKINKNIPLGLSEDNWVKRQIKNINNIFQEVENNALTYLNPKDKKLYKLQYDLQLAKDEGDEEKIKKLQEQVDKERLKFTDEESYIWNPDTGKLETIKYSEDGSVDYSGASEYSKEINNAAIDLLEKEIFDNEGNISGLYSRQVKEYHEIVALAKMIKGNYEEVTSGEGGFTKKLSAFFTNEETKDIIYTIAETGKLPEKLSRDWFEEGAGTNLGEALNEKINEYLITSRAIALNMNPFFEGNDWQSAAAEEIDRKARQLVGFNITSNQKEFSADLFVNKILYDSGMALNVDDVQVTERFKTSVGQLTFGMSLDLAELMIAIYGFKKLPPYDSLMKGIGRVGQFLTNPKILGPMASNPYWKQTVKTVVGLEGKGQSGIKEMITLMGADKALEITTGHHPMPAEFGLILGMSNQITEQKFLAKKLMMLAAKTPGLKYLMGVDGKGYGLEVVKALTSATIATPTMTFTEAVQTAYRKGILKDDEWNSFSEVFMSADPNEPWYGKMMSTYFSFAALGLGSTKLGTLMYNDLRAGRDRVTRSEIESTDILNKKEYRSQPTIEGQKRKIGDPELVDPLSTKFDVENQSSGERLKEIDAAYNRAKNAIENNKDLSKEERREKLEEIDLAKRHLKQAVHYKTGMDGIEKTNKYTEKQYLKVQKINLDKWVQSENLSDIPAESVIFFGSQGQQGINVLARTLTLKHGYGPKEANRYAKQIINGSRSVVERVTRINENLDSPTAQKLATNLIQGDVLAAEKNNLKKQWELSQKEGSEIKMTEAEYKQKKGEIEQKEVQNEAEFERLFKESQAEGLKITQDKVRVTGESGMTNVEVLRDAQWKERGLGEGGGFFSSKDGKIIFNVDEIRRRGSTGVFEHEAGGHKLIASTLRDANGKLTPSGKRILRDFRNMMKNDTSIFNEIQKEIKDNYKDLNSEGALEEFFAHFVEKLANKQFGEGAFQGSKKAITEVKTAEDLLNLSIDFVKEVEGMVKGDRTQFGEAILKILRQGVDKAAIEGEQWRSKKSGESFKLDPAEGKLSEQINRLVTTTNKADFVKQDINNIYTNIIDGKLDAVIFGPKGPLSQVKDPAQRQEILLNIGTRLTGLTERGGFDPAKGASLYTWLYNAAEKSLRDLRKKQATESDTVTLDEVQAERIVDDLSPSSGPETATQRANAVNVGLRIRPEERDLIKQEVANQIILFDQTTGLQNLNRKNLQQLRNSFIKGPDGSAKNNKIRKLILQKVKELGPNGLSSKEGAKLLLEGISLSRMSNSLKGGGKGFEIFLEPVLKKDGTQERYTVEEANALGIALDKSGSGPLKYKKRKLSDLVKDGKPTQEFLDWIKGTDIASGARGRKNSIINELTGEMGINIMNDILVNQKIIKPIRDKDGKIIGTEEVDLFPDSSAAEKTAIASDQIVALAQDLTNRVYQNNGFYSKKVNTELKGTLKGLNELFKTEPINMALALETFLETQPKSAIEALDRAAAGVDKTFQDFILDFYNEALRQQHRISNETYRLENPEGYETWLASKNQRIKVIKKYLDKKGIKYYSEKDLLKDPKKTLDVYKDFIKMFGPWKDLTAGQKKFIEGAIGVGKGSSKGRWYKALGLWKTRGDKKISTEEMLVEVFGEDILTGGGIEVEGKDGKTTRVPVELGDIHTFEPTANNKKALKKIIENKDNYTPQELRDQIVKLLIPKGKGVEYFDTMIQENLKSLGNVLKGLGDIYKKKNYDKNYLSDNIANFLQQQTNYNTGIKALFPITSMLLEAKGSIDSKGNLTSKEIHFEHNKELLNFTKDYLDIITNKKLSTEQRNKKIDDLVQEATQSIISEEMRAIKDSPAMGGRVISPTKGKSGLESTYDVSLGSSKKAIYLPSKTGETVADHLSQSQRRKEVESILTKEFKALNKKGIKLPDVGLTTDGVLTRNRQGQLEFYSRKQKNKELNFSINEIIERTVNIPIKKKITQQEARVQGKDKSPFMKYFYGAEDFGGLTHSILSGEGKQGNVDIKFFRDNLEFPYNKGITKTETYQQTIKKDFGAFLKEARIDKVIKKLPGEGKGLEKIIEGTSFSYDQAIRIYLWDKANYKIPGLEKVDQTKLVNLVKSNPELQAFAEGLLKIGKNDKFTKPGDYWDVRNLSYDMLVNQTNRARTAYLGEFINNVDVIFSKDNLNKLEAAYGPEYRSALESSIRRMKSGSNRPGGGTKTENAFLNWTNNSVGAIMFFNRKSALLQTISSVNFINWGDNNPIEAAKAFANQPQFWKDFSYIWNSDKLKTRREGLGLDVNHNEIAKAIKGSTNKAAAALSYLLKLGFTPTQLADSFAIASGGATMYRNRVNTYLKEGLSAKEAEAKAWEDFSRISEETQQSADASLISQQQASTLGRLVLAFKNTPMQYTRIITKSMRNLAKGRGDFKTEVSKIAYYGVVQNMMFASLQNALFSEIQGFDGDDAEVEISPEKQNKRNKKVKKIVNQMFDTVAQGLGVYGAMPAQLKNVVMKYIEQENLDPFQRDHALTLLEIVNYSPPIGSKLRKVYNAIRTKEFEKDIIAERGWDITYDGKVNLSPSYNVIGSLTEGVTNVPMERTLVELNSLVEMLDTKNSAFQRLALLLGWRSWDVGASNEEMEELSVQLKERKKQEKKEAREREKEEKRKQEQQRRFIGKTDEEIDYIKKSDSIKKYNRNEQIDQLKKLGVDPKELKGLKEDDLIRKIIELSEKKETE